MVFITKFYQLLPSLVRSSKSSQGQCSIETNSLLDWQFNLSMRLMPIKIFKRAAPAPIHSKRHLPFYQDDSQGRSETFSFGGTTGGASFATRGAVNGLCRTFRKRPENFWGATRGARQNFGVAVAPLAPP